jgi:glucose/arabinose dehydrogenase
MPPPSPSRHAARVGRGAAAMALLVSLGAFAVQALAGAPAVVEITEPAEGGAALNPADVHMVASFAEDEEHVCSDWEIRLAGSSELVWEAPCAKGQLKVHIHLGDGTFVGSHEGRLELLHDTDYVLVVRSRDDVGEEVGDPATRQFTTRPRGSVGDDATSWTVRAGYAVEVFARDLRLPVDIAMVPEPGPHPGDPLMYVTELYGTVKVITRDGSVRDYATGLLNFDPTGNFPGSGEVGVTGAVVDPVSGDVFVSLIYEDEDSPAESKPHYPKVIRLHSDERGLEAIGQTTVLDMEGEVQEGSHQISNLTLTPAGALLVHNGDSPMPIHAQDIDRYRGKILRMTLDGEPLPSNPFYSDEGDDTARDYVYAYGLRNPFGGALRLSDGSYFMVENGPAIDRLAIVLAGENYKWPLDPTMGHLAAYNWNPPHAPVSIEFVEPQRFGGSGFPPEAMGHAFVTESGSTWASGPQELGKRIVELGLDEAGGLTGGPEMLVEYAGTGKATAVGLAAGADGLYFTDLYKDKDFTSPVDRGANVLRVRYCGEDCPVRPSPPMPPPAAPSAEAEAEADLTPPAVRRFRLSRSAFTARPRARHRVRRSAPRHGTDFLYALSERASVSIGIRRRGRTLPRGLLFAPGRAGGNRRPFAGWLEGEPLAPGRYVATIQARDRAGNVARSSAGFRVLDRLP